MPMEFLSGRPLGPEELDAIRRQIEGMDRIDAISDEMRALVLRNWPHLAAKLPQNDGNAQRLVREAGAAWPCDKLRQAGAPGMQRQLLPAADKPSGIRPGQLLGQWTKPLAVVRYGTNKIAKVCNFEQQTPYPGAIVQKG